MRIATAIICLLAAAGQLRASILVLPNGDRLTGQVLKREDGQITFKSEWIGTITLPDDRISVEEPRHTPTPADSLAGLAPRFRPPTRPGTPAADAVRSVSQFPWFGKIEFGYENLLSKDVRTVNTTIRAQAERELRSDDLLVNGRVLYSRSSGIATADEHDAEFRWRHNLSDWIFTQSDSTYISDNARRISYEIQENAGLGLKLVKARRQMVDVGLGVIEQDRKAVGVEQGLSTMGSVFQDYAYRLSGHYTLAEDFTAQYSPQTRDRTGIVAATGLPATGSERDYDYRFHTTLQGRITKHLSLNLHFEYEFDNAILDPNSRGSQRVSTTVGYGF